MTRSVRLGSKFTEIQATAVKDHAYQHHLSVVHTKLFYAQRNLYLTGFTLCLGFVLTRYIASVVTVCNFEERMGTVEATMADRRKTTILQQKKYEDLEAELALLREKSADAEASLKQAKAQQTEYDRLSAAYSELEDRIRGEDFKSK